MPLKLKHLVFIFCLLLTGSSGLWAQQVNPSLFNCMKWRMIGPYRGGRTVGAAGIASEPNVFYIGVNNGGVWKTNDFGRTWNPVFDEQSTGSIGDVIVSPSNPQVVYAASGEGLQRPDLSVGNGMYRSADGGKTWQHCGLENGFQIGGLAIDPKDENRVFAAVLGHPYGANPERGVYRTVNGGKTWEKVLYTDENTGAIQVVLDPANSQIVYADLWAARQAPWENGSWEGSGSGLMKSIDGGATWKKLEKGLPGRAEGLGRIGFCIAPSKPQRMYAVVYASKEAGVYRSDDAGESWYLLSRDYRLWDRGDDFAEIKVDPKNPDIIYDANVVVWKSTDGGKNWKGFKGAPGGDDYHRLWINPENTKIMLLCSDQGAGVSVNGGETWSSWYNQPTAQLYHVSADNAFPYNVYGGQQESGSVGIASRGNDGAITTRDWHPVGAEEYGYVVADPLDPNIVYGGKLSRYDKRTGQTQDISPAASRGGAYRFLRTAPVVFSPLNPRILFYAGNVVFKTGNGGNSWEVISPDLTRSSYSVPSSIGIYANENMKSMKPRGVVYTLAPSALDSGIIWAGTDDGLIQLTQNGGKTWKDVSAAQLSSWQKVSMIEASHFDPATAYAAVNGIRLDDMHPHIYKTTDAGKSWTEIVNGLPQVPINTIKEDPLCKGLLFAGSETAVYVSFDDGLHWQSLRLNMPASSIRDLVIKDNDLVVATHGRSFWILDDMILLRQLKTGDAANHMILYAPQEAWRLGWDTYTDTPLPPDEPAGKNPPDGAIIDYYLKEKVKGELLLEILDSSGRTVRQYSSSDKPYRIPDVNIPLYWIRQQQILPADSGSHRFLWDMREEPLQMPATYPIAAIFGETPPAPTAPWVLPGKYKLRLRTQGKTETQELILKMDPRVHASPELLKKQYDLSEAIYRDARKANQVLAQLDTLLKQAEFIVTRCEKQKTTSDSAARKKCLELEQLRLRIAALRGDPEKHSTASFASLLQMQQGLFTALQAADRMPTMQQQEAFLALHKRLEEDLVEWKKLDASLQEWNKLFIKAPF
jgi:photosystem II stability/assembly factor-like uncharacterized protein